MKKTLYLLVAMSMSVACAEVTLHETTFGTTVSNGGQLTSLDALYHITTSAAWTNMSGSITGLYFDEGTGGKFNHKTNNTVTYLYIHEGLTFCHSTAHESGYINFSDTYNHGFGITSTEGAWLDINADYGAHIAMQNMNSGSVYLNEYGALSAGYLSINGNTQGYKAGELTTSNTVYATAVFDTSEMTSGTYTLNTSTNEVTRTLLTGDYSSWTSLGDKLKDHVVLAGVTDYSVSATSTGLSVTYNLSSKAVPEPATATLSLLALAGLAARRRRK